MQSLEYVFAMWFSVLVSILKAGHSLLLLHALIINQSINYSLSYQVIKHMTDTTLTTENRKELEAVVMAL